MASNKTPKQSLRTKKIDDKRGTNPNSLANLKPFEPGVSGNPGGRPHKLSDAYARVLRAKFPKKLMGEDFKEVVKEYTESDSIDITYADKIALTTGLNASKGDTQAAKEIRASTEGENINQNGTLVIRVQWGDEPVDADGPLSEITHGAAADSSE